MHRVLVSPVVADTFFFLQAPLGSGECVTIPVAVCHRRPAAELVTSQGMKLGTCDQEEARYDDWCNRVGVLLVEEGREGAADSAGAGRRWHWARADTRQPLGLRTLWRLVGTWVVTT